MLEDAYVGFSDAGLNPKILDGLQAARKFPGFSAERHYRGLLLPRLCEVDVSRYRNGVLEFVRERLGQERILILSVGHIEVMPGGLRFHSNGKAHTARIHDQILVFPYT